MGLIALCVVIPFPIIVFPRNENRDRSLKENDVLV